MSQTDDNSSEGDSTSERNPALTGTGCYKNYDHVASHRKTSHNLVSGPMPILHCNLIESRPLFCNALTLLLPLMPPLSPMSLATAFGRR